MVCEIVPQDQTWVKQAKKNLMALYEDKPLERMPFEFVTFDMTDCFKPQAQSNVSEDNPGKIAEERRKFLDAQLQLDAQLKSIADRVRQGFWDDTILALHPLAGATGWMVEVFGGKTVWFANRPPYPHPVITEAKDVDSLRPDFAKSQLYQAAISHLQFYREVVEDKIPIGAPDLQSPIDIASMVLDYQQLIYAMIDDPVRVHSLMRMITDAIIHACHAFRKEMADYTMTTFNWWMPRGIFLSDDLQAVLNEECYREFAVPYNEILAKEFGGLGVHSCGRIIQNVDTVAGMKGLIAFNTHDPLAAIAPIVKNRAVPIIGGIEEVVNSAHPASKRPFHKTAQEVEDFWWNDFEKLTSIKGQRFLYQCHALLHKKTPQQAYDRMLVLAQQSAHNLNDNDRKVMEVERKCV